MTEPTKPREPEKDAGKEMAQGILDFGSALTHTPHGAVYCLTIIGQIEGHVTASSGTKTTKYEHVLPLLAKLEESEEVDGILFLLNTAPSLPPPRPTIILSGSRSGLWPLWQRTAVFPPEASRP